jgi:LysM repeat protein
MLESLPSFLKQLNNLPTNILTIGQQIQIPTSEFIETPTTTITYTVIPGDTLYSIARTYNTSVNNIKELNNLSNNILTVGQQLLISP